MSASLREAAEDRVDELDVLGEKNLLKRLGVMGGGRFSFRGGGELAF
jgi:hypothetical protein